MLIVCLISILGIKYSPNRDSLLSCSSIIHSESQLTVVKLLFGTEIEYSVK